MPEEMTSSSYFESISKFIDEHTDDSSRDLPLMNHMVIPYAIVLIYLIFVKKVGPKLMENVEPFKLDGVIKIYNTLQIFANAYVLWLGFGAAYGPNGMYKFLCQPLRLNSQEDAIINRMCYHYFILKVVDLTETVIFVLRKKSKQISTLHLYHHSFMVIVVWHGVRFFPNGSGAVMAVLNLFVHVIMYTYYLASNIVKDNSKLIAWKKHMTQLQILQFFLDSLYYTNLLIFEDCGYPKLMIALLMPFFYAILILFLKFYYDCYIVPQKRNGPSKETSTKTSLKED